MSETTIDVGKNVGVLLEKLASELGTNTKYLWSVLIKQAPIEATITLIQTLLILLFGYVLFRLHKKFLRDIPDKQHSYYDEYDVALTIPMGLGCALFLILLIVAFFCLKSMITGYLNPEYWALHKVLQTIKQ